MMMMMTTAAEK